jgi:hypothetical protein
MRYRFNRGGNFKAAQIGAAKNVSSIRWRGHQSNLNWNGGVQTDSVRFDFAAQGCLFQVYEKLLPVQEIMITERGLQSKPHAFPYVPQMRDARIDLWRPRHELSCRRGTPATITGRGKRLKYEIVGVSWFMFLRAFSPALRLCAKLVA